MTLQYIEIGPVPAAENCAQVGDDDYRQKARRECRTYAKMLERLFGIAGEPLTFVVRSHAHDFGTYYEVSAAYDPASAVARDGAFRAEREAPDEWDDQARFELAWFQRRDLAHAAWAAGGVGAADVPRDLLTCEPPRYVPPAATC